MLVGSVRNGADSSLIKKRLTVETELFKKPWQ